MARPGNQNHKKRYDRYKNSGRREENKKLRAERHEKRKARFAKRREDGLAYQYKPNPYKKDTAEHMHEANIRNGKNVFHGNKTEFAKWISVFRVLKDEIERNKKAAKAAESKGKGKRHHSSPLDEYDDAE